MLTGPCVQGTRTTIYRRCTHEVFAPFGECARWDGLVERITTFADNARHVVEEVSGVRLTHTTQRACF